jgi:diguanylate cyclase (GGDEF)-like protein/PAS domain S-box-containing protein
MDRTLQEHPGAEAALASIGHAVIVTDLAGKVTRWNAAAETLYGWSTDEAIGRAIGELVVPRGLAHDGAEIMADVMAGATWSGEFTVARKDGSTFHALVTNSPLRDERGGIVGIIGVSSDITHFRRMERRYAALVEHASDLIVLLDADGIVQYASPAVERVLGVAMESVAGTRAFDHVHPSDRRDVIAAFRHSTINGVPVSSVVFRVHDVAGGWRWLDAATNIVNGPAGRELVIVARDVTEQERARRELERSEARFRALATRASDLALMCDETGRITYVSDAVTGLLGYEREDIEGMVGFDFVHPDDVPAVQTVFAKALVHPGPQPPIEFRVRAHDGSWHWCEERITNLLDDPDVGALVANLTDVTDRREAVDALRVSEATYRSIVETAEEGIWIGDSDGRTIFANRKLAVMLGLPTDRIEGRSAHEFIHHEDLAKATHALRRRCDGISDRQELRFWKTDGTILWTIVAGTPYYDADGNFVGSLAMITDITDRKQAEQELARRALTDELTGLANRRVLLDRIDHALLRRAGERLAVLFIDLDDFKLVNDSFGHAAGDELLVTVADRLRNAARRGDTVARLGGDEFVVLCEDVTDADDVLVVAERLQASLAAPVTVGETRVFVAASIGVALSPAASADELLRNADAAMYLAKDRGKARCALYDERLQEAAVARLRTLGELRRSIEDERFVVHYQPIVDLTTNVPVSVEALVRWDHPTEGLLYPGRFMPEAEATGLVVEIGEQVLRRACHDLGVARRRHPHLRVSVNLSARQLATDDLVHVVESALRDGGIPPEALTLEVTESSLMEDAEQGTRTLNALRAMGVSLSLDDFGTGYSSLAYLRTLPVDEVKIDRSFISTLGTDPTGRALVDGIVRLTHAVGLRVVAEGIEHRSQLRHLRRLGCDVGQGFLWSPAVPFEVLDDVLANVAAPASREVPPVVLDDSSTAAAVGPLVRT